MQEFLHLGESATGIKMHQKLNFGVALLHCIPARSDVVW